MRFDWIGKFCCHGDARYKPKCEHAYFLINYLACGRMGYDVCGFRGGPDPEKDPPEECVYLLEIMLLKDKFEEEQKNENDISI